MKGLALLVAVCVLMTALVISVSADDKQVLTGAEIVSKHLSAVGGKEVLMKFKSRVAIGTVKKENEPDAQMAIMSEAPNRISAMFVFQSFTWQQTYDGKSAICRPPFSRSAQVLESKYREMLATGTMFNGISLYNILLQGESETLKFEAKGMKKVRGRQAYVVAVKKDKDDSMRLCFDAETFMWLRTEYGRINLNQDMKGFTNAITSKDEQLTVDFYVETWDFKDVAGVKLPFKFEESVTTPILKQKAAGTIVGTITQYQHNIPIDPKMFQ